MGTASLVRRWVLGLAVVVTGACSSAEGRSDEVSAAAHAAGLVIHGPAETLSDYCREEDGALWLMLPSGARFELVTSTSDPCITNPGSGTFHPFDETVVREALSSVRFATLGISAEIFLLPYPRRSQLQSAAGPGLILLSPGVAPVPVEQQHAATVHELGHVVQYARMPDEAGDSWIRYRTLRGITDETRFNSAATHADRPHEIFAEDFRALFGGSLSTSTGTIENADLPHPSLVPGLESYLASLAPFIAEGDLRAVPNPSPGSTRFHRNGGAAATLELYDVAGRRLASLEPTRTAEGWSWSWDGTDAAGRPVAGLVFARPRGGGRPAIRLTLLR